MLGAAAPWPVDAPSSERAWYGLDVAQRAEPPEKPLDGAVQPDLGQLIDSRRVLLCVGCGGVGKTTTCAAIGLAAAQRGKRVLCLTIDPSQRLAQSLGLERINTEAQQIDPQVLADAGLDVSGSLTVMMLDTKRTFDALIETLAPTAEKRDAILGNVIYHYISTSLAGSSEYMAMEKLYAVKDDPRYDLVVLDTPPTSHALDFLDAPQRLVGAFDSPALRWLLQAFQSSGTLSLGVLARTAATVLRGIGRIVGGGFLERMGGFAVELNEVFGGWRARADEVARALRGPEVAYLLVTTPQPMCVREVLFFAQRLRQQQLRADAYVVNRVHRQAPDGISTEAIEQALSSRELGLPSSSAERIAATAADEARLGQLDRLHMVTLEEVFDDGDDDSAAPLVVQVPDFATDIYDVERLASVAAVLVPSR